jgi:hypothetical protein
LSGTSEVQRYTKKQQSLFGLWDEEAIDVDDDGEDDGEEADETGADATSDGTFWCFKTGAFLTRT